MILGQIPLPLRPKIWLAMPAKKLNSEQNPEGCDATEADQGTKAGEQKNTQQFNKHGRLKTSEKLRYCGPH